MLNPTEALNTLREDKSCLDRFDTINGHSPKRGYKMENKTKLDQDHDVFSAKNIEDIIILKIKETFLLRATDLKAKADLLNYLNLVSENGSIKVVIIIGSPHERKSKEYIEFYRQILEWESDEIAFARIYNAIDQTILSIKKLDKIVIHIDRRQFISLFLNMSLACDYRIVSDNAIFQNVHLDLGLVPKGGAPYFLSKMIGLSKTCELLLSAEDFTAQEALSLGVVNKIVPSGQLEGAAMKTAQHFAKNPANSLSGIKRLLNYSTKDLEDYLKLENNELFQIVNYTDFRNRLGLLKNG